MVKNLQKIGLLLGAGLCLGSMQVSAQTLYEPFTGTGPVAGYNEWITSLGTPEQTMRTAGSLTYPGLKESTGDKVTLGAFNDEYLNRLFAEPITSGTIYGSALINVVDTDGFLDNSTIGNYFMHFVRIAGSTPYQARVYVRTGSKPNTFNIGILNNTNAGGPATPVSGTEMYGDNPIDFAVGKTYLLVFNHDMDANTSSIWFNPALGTTDEPAPMYTATAGAPTPTISGIAFRQTNRGGLGTGNIEVDEMRFGPTFADVTPGSTTGLKDFASAGLQLYPNPTTGAINLQLPTSFAGKSQIGLTLYSVNGDVLLKTSGSEAAINEQLSSKLKSAAAGMYLIRIDNGPDSYQSRIVKN